MGLFFEYFFLRAPPASPLRLIPQQYSHRFTESVTMPSHGKKNSQLAEFHRALLRPRGAWHEPLRAGQTVSRAVFVSPRLYGPCNWWNTVIAQSRRNFGRPGKLMERSLN